MAFEAGRAPCGRQRLHARLALAVLAALTLAVYAQTASFDFLTYDDNLYITENRVLSDGLTPATLRWAFTTIYTGNWMPLTWVTHLFVAHVFGYAPGWHHLANVLLHGANSLLLFSAFLSLTGCVGRSFFVAAVFAVHPLHVESVAWVAERKDVLMVFFGLLALLSWLRWVRRRRRGWYALSLCLFIAALMSKAMMVVLPVLFLLLDLWPLGRLAGRRGRWSSRLPALAELAPFFALSAAAGMAAFAAQRAAGAMSLEGLLDGREKAAHAFSGTLWYALKTLWPSRLAIFYPYPVGGEPASRVAAGAVLVVGVLAAGWLLRKRASYLLTGWLWFLVCLLPILGLVQVGEQAYADRYAYLSQTGLAVAVAWGAVQLTAGRRIRLLLAPSAAVALAAATIVAFSSAAFWHDSETLYRRAIAVTEGNYVAHSNYGEYLMRAGRLPEAITHFQQAIRHNPRSGKMHNNLGIALASQGKTAEAIAAWLESLRRTPNAHETLYNLSRALLHVGREAEGRAAAGEAQKLQPDFPRALNNLGVDSAQRGEYREGVRLLSLAAGLAPGESAYRSNLEAARRALAEPAPRADR